MPEPGWEVAGAGRGGCELPDVRAGADDRVAPHGVPAVRGLASRRGPDAERADQALPGVAPHARERADRQLHPAGAAALLAGRAAAAVAAPGTAGRSGAGAARVRAGR